jgi:hypothetical protein
LFLVCLCVLAHLSLLISLVFWFVLFCFVSTGTFITWK